MNACIEEESTIIIFYVKIIKKITKLIINQHQWRAGSNFSDWGQSLCSVKAPKNDFTLEIMVEGPTGAPQMQVLQGSCFPGKFLNKEALIFWTLLLTVLMRFPNPNSKFDSRDLFMLSKKSTAHGFLSHPLTSMPLVNTTCIH